MKSRNTASLDRLLVSKLVRLWRIPWVNWIARLAFAGLLIGLLLARVDFVETLNTLGKANFGLLLLALLFFFLIRYILAYQMSLGLAPLGLRSSVFELFKIRLISGFYGLILPGDLVAGGVSWYKLSRGNNNAIEVGALLIYFRLIYIFALLIVGFIGLWLDSHWGSPALRLLVGILLVGMALLFLPFVSSRVSNFIARTGRLLAPYLPIPAWIRAKVNAFINAVAAFQTLSRTQLLLVIGLSLVVQVLQKLVFYFCAKAVGIGLSVFVLIWIHSFVTIIQMIPVSISGLGVREVSLVLLLRHYGVSESRALSLSLVMFGMIVTTSLLGGLFELWDVLKGNSAIRSSLSEKGLESHDL